MKMYFYKGCENIKKINIYKLKNISILSIILIIFFSGYCLAKYELTQKLFFSSEVAIPILEVEGTEKSKINAINTVGYYDFVVKNYNENNTSDVSQNYSIEVISDADETIEFELFREDEKINLVNNKTDKIFIEGMAKKEDYYRLKIAYDKQKNDSQEDIIEDVQIKVHSEQIKI